MCSILTFRYSFLGGMPDLFGAAGGMGAGMGGAAGANMGGMGGGATGGLDVMLNQLRSLARLGRMGSTYNMPGLFEQTGGLAAIAASNPLNPMGARNPVIPGSV